MARPLMFFRQVQAEARKIVWPSQKETLMSAVAVFIMVFIAALYLFLTDQVLSFILRFILNLGA